MNMKLNLSIAVLTVYPMMTTAWLFGSDLMLRDPTMSSLAHPRPVRSLIQQQHQQLQNLMNREFFTQSYPRYDISDDGDTFKIMVQVPGMTQDDVQVSLENDGKVLSIKGSHETKEDGCSTSSSFTQSFTLDPSIVVDGISANLKDGVLVVTAPKDLKKLEESIRKIPITYMQEGIASGDTKNDGKVEEAAEKVEHAIG